MADVPAIDFKLIPEKQVEAAVLNPYDRIGWPGRTKEHITVANRQVRELISSGINQGKGYPEVAKDLKERLDITAGKANTIARTEAHRAREMGKLAATQDAADQGLIFKRRWVAAMDANTRDTHGAMDGQEIDVYDKDGNASVFQSPDGGTAEFPGGFGIAALDINCRCTTVDVYEGFEPKTRRTREDDLIEYTTYGDYAKAKGWPRPYAGAEPRVAVPGFVPAETTKEAEQWAKQNLNVTTVDYSKMELTLANEVNQQAQHYIKMYNVGDQSFSILPKKGNSFMSVKSTFVDRRAIKITLYYNPEFTNTMTVVNSNAKFLMDRKYMFNTNYRELVTHEVGHLVDVMATSRMGSARVSDKLYNIMIDTANAQGRRYYNIVDDLAVQHGSYLKTNEAELFAEMFRLKHYGKLGNEYKYISDYIGGLAN